MRAGFWLAAGLLALAAGCGGSSSKSSEPATTTQAAAATTTAARVLPSFTKNCAQLAKLGETFATAMQNTSADTALADTAKGLQQMADAAPSEIRDEFHTIADAFTGYAQALQDAGVTLGQTPTAAQIAELAGAAKELAKPEVKAAQEKITAWSAANCGVTATTGG